MRTAVIDQTRVAESGPLPRARRDTPIWVVWIARWRIPETSRRFGACWGTNRMSLARIRSTTSTRQRTHVERRFHIHTVAGAKPVEFSYRIRRRGGAYTWFETVITPIVSNGQVVQLQSSSRDITERKRTEEELVRLAFHDELTGLPNRALALDRIGQALAVAGSTNQPSGVFIDLDVFKVSTPLATTRLMHTLRRRERGRVWYYRRHTRRPRRRRVREGLSRPRPASASSPGACCTARATVTGYGRTSIHGQHGSPSRKAPTTGRLVENEHFMYPQNAPAALRFDLRPDEAPRTQPPRHRVRAAARRRAQRAPVALPTRDRSRHRPRRRCRSTRALATR